MRITTFEYRDADGWTLKPVEFDGFNLLVGISGAGKTRIVRAVEQVCAIALGVRATEEYVERARGATFTIGFEQDGHAYRWEAELEPSRQSVGEQEDAPLIRKEHLTADGAPLIERTSRQFRIRGQDSALLNRQKSAIALLREDPGMSPLHVAFSLCVFRQLSTFPSRGSIFANAPEQYRGTYPSLASLGAELRLPLHHKAYVLHTQFRSAFSEIEESLKEAFPLIEELSVHRYRADVELAVGPIEAYHIVLAVKESGVANWILFDEMSSGMQRYLVFLVHLSFAPPGTVVLIDELETSLGVNCLPAATRFLLSRAKDLQLILTSHHPYIIEQIPSAFWKIVTRHGSEVRVLDAAKIPALEEGKTHLDRFTRLINLPEYDGWAEG